MEINIKKYFKNKNIILLFVALLGIVLVVGSGIKKEAETVADTDITEYEYINVLENRVEQIISTVEGAGNCEVMINIASSSESVYVKENKKSFDNSTEQNRGESEDSVLTMTDQNGNQYAVVSKKIMPEITGVIVTCDGGDNAFVKSSIIEAVCTLLGIGSNNVCVIAKS